MSVHGIKDNKKYKKYFRVSDPCFLWFFSHFLYQVVDSKMTAMCCTSELILPRRARI